MGSLTTTPLPVDCRKFASIHCVGVKCRVHALSFKLSTCEVLSLLFSDGRISVFVSRRVVIIRPALPSGLNKEMTVWIETEYDVHVYR